MSKEPNALRNYCVQSLDMAAAHSLSVAATDSLYSCNWSVALSICSCNRLPVRFHLDIHINESTASSKWRHTSSQLQLQIETRSLSRYGVATISRLLKITGLFCRILSLLQGSFFVSLGTYVYRHTSRCVSTWTFRMETSASKNNLKSMLSPTG